VVLGSAPPRSLGIESGARLRFGEEERRRREREYGANETVSLACVEARLAAGIEGLDEPELRARPRDSRASGPVTV
jgi:hypothetical protein